MTLTVVTSGQASNGLILDNGDQVYIAGGTTYFTYIYYGGIESSYAGGESFYTTVQSGGLIEVGAGGAAEYSAIGSGGQLVVNGDGRTDGAIVVADGEEIIFGQGFSEGTIVETGGELMISSGGTADNAIIQAGARADLFDGGSATNIQISGGTLYAGSGTIVGTQIFSGGFLEPHGTISSTTIFTSGSDRIQMATAISTTLSGGLESVADDGVTYSTVVDSGGEEIVPTGTTYFEQINNGGLENLLGGRSIFTTINGGEETVDEGGTADNTDVDAGGYLHVYGGSLASNTFVSDNGLLEVTGGASAVGTVVADKGMDYLDSGGSAVGSIVSSGGDEAVYLGGTTTGTEVQAGGTQFVDFVGVASATMIDGGIQIVGTVDNLGGEQPPNTSSLAVSTTINQGGQEIDNYFGTTEYTTINNGGVEDILNGCLAVATTVNQGGEEFVSSGGTTSVTTINSGGFEILSSGAVMINTTLNERGAIDFANLAYTDTGTITSAAPIERGVASTTLIITEGGESVTAQLNGYYSGEYFHLEAAPPGLSGTILTVDDTPPCFAAGTRLLADTGWVAVESLHVGGRMVTRNKGEAEIAKIVWIGRRRVDVAAHPHPERVRPVRFVSGSLADGVPTRALLLSPDHALLMDGKLIAARQLVNGGSITVEHVPRVEYFHVELERHGILLAEGVETESYLDTGNRHQFDGQAAVSLHADFSRTDHPDACAPLVTDEARVRPIWQRLAERAARLGFQDPHRRTSNEAELHLVLPDGSRLAPVASSSAVRKTFLLHQSGDTIRSVRLSSRHNAPAEIRPWQDDRRQLGVAVSEIHLCTVDNGITIRRLLLDDVALSEGWWPAESHDGQSWRWSNGNARIALPPGCIGFDVHVWASGEYLVENRTQDAVPRGRRRARLA